MHIFFIAFPICYAGKSQAILSESESPFHLRSCQDQMPNEDALRSEKEMCVKTEWQQFLKAQTRDYFIKIDFLGEMVSFPFSVISNLGTL